MPDKRLLAANVSLAAVQSAVASYITTRRLCSVLIVFAIFCAVIPAHAGVIYSTGFENPPFALGHLNGLGGWTSLGASSAVTIENTVVRSGSQAVQIDSSLATPATGGMLISDVAAPVVDVSADLEVTTSTLQNGYQFGARGRGGTFIGGINIGSRHPPHGSLPLNTAIDLLTSGFPAIPTVFTRDVWHHVDLLFDFTAQTYTFSLDGAIAVSGVAFCGDPTCSGSTVTSFHGISFETFSTTSGRNDFGYIDNYAVASVPEPGSLSLFALGILLFDLRKHAVSRPTREDPQE